MSQLARRAEEIGAYLVKHALGVDVTKHDRAGRQSAVDFMLEWPDGRKGALEVTLVTEAESSAWQGLAAREDWRWPAPTGWEFRLSGADMPYQRTRQAVKTAIVLCDAAGVDAPDQLPAAVRQRHHELEWVSAVGDLRRTPFSPGVVLLPQVRAEFAESSSSDFATVVESWLHLPHMSRHIDKVRVAETPGERHLFLVPVTRSFPPGSSPMTSRHRYAGPRGLTGSMASGSGRTTGTSVWCGKVWSARGSTSRLHARASRLAEPVASAKAKAPGAQRS